MRRLGMGLEGADHPKFLTLTSPAGDTPTASMRLLSARFEKLRRLVRQRGWRGEFEFGGVVELTQRGIAHFHVLFRGPWLLQATWSRLAVEAGFGEVVWIERASKGKLTGYVTKALAGRAGGAVPAYVTKTLAKPSSFPRHYRRVRFSRGWAPGWVVQRTRNRETQGASPWELVGYGTPQMGVYLALLAAAVHAAGREQSRVAGGLAP
jgi:hypothetical protein